MRICDLRQKEVINIKDCKRLGYVCDIEFDLKNRLHNTVDCSGHRKNMWVIRTRYGISHSILQSMSDWTRYHIS